MTEISTHVQKLFSDMDERWREAEARSGRRYLTLAARAAYNGARQPTEGEGIRMARTTTARRKTATKTPAKPARATRKASAASKPKPVETKRAMTRRSDAEKLKLGKQIIARTKKGETMSAVAAELKLYPFQAHQLVAAVHVENGDVEKITGSKPEMVLKRLIAAREKGDRYASFDYLQARSGINKVKIRKMFTDAGRADLLTDVRQSDKRVKASATRAKAARAKGGARRAAGRAGMRAAKPVAATAKSARTRATAAKAAAKPAQRTAEVKPSKAASRTTKATPARPPASVSGGKRRRIAKSADEFDSKAAIDKGIAKRKAETPAAKPARKLQGAAARSAERKAKADAPKRTRRPVNVPKGARPSAADPS